MVVIILDPDGLFHGRRLARCSDLAQFYYPRLLLASNGYGRIELDFERIRCEAFQTIRVKPTDDQLRKTFEEFAENFLLFLFEADGQAWGQWDVLPNWLPRYKNATDRRSPAPDPDKFQKWIILGKSQRTNDFGNFRKISENFCPAVAVAGVVAVAVADSIPEVVGPVETSENPSQQKTERARIVQRGQERLLELRKQHEQKQPEKIVDSFDVTSKVG